MSSPLETVPIDKRKQFAATLGLFATLFLAVGAVAATGPATMIVRTFVVIALVVAVLLALMAWGVVHSIRGQLAERDLDAIIEDALAASPSFGQMCDCGHEHDPRELHVTDDACAHDGGGAECSHSCDTCVLSALRPSPKQTRAERLTN